jgi:hypothetical protein
MAWNSAAPYTKALMFIHDAGVALGGPRGGELTIDPNVELVAGVGGQSAAQGGVIATTLRVDLFNPVKSYLTGMPRASVSTQSTNYDFEVGVSDGSWNLTKIQPAGFNFGFTANPAAMPTWTLNYWAALAAESASGAAQAANAGTVTDCGTDFVVTVDTLDAYCVGGTVALNTNPSWFRAANTKSAGYKRFPDAVLLGGGGDVWSCHLDCAKRILETTTDNFADTIDYGIEVKITGSTVSFTLSNLCSPRETTPFPTDDGPVIWGYDFVSLPGFGKGLVS